MCPLIHTFVEATRQCEICLSTIACNHFVTSCLENISDLGNHSVAHQPLSVALLRTAGAILFYPLVWAALLVTEPDDSTLDVLIQYISSVHAQLCQAEGRAQTCSSEDSVAHHIKVGVHVCFPQIQICCEVMNQTRHARHAYSLMRSTHSA